MLLSFRFCWLATVLWTVSLTSARAQEVPCQLCAPSAKPSSEQAAERQPIRIDVETALDFSRMTQIAEGEGEVGLEAQSGTRRVSGTLSDLGGLSLRGSVRITGQPLQPVLITLPNRVQLRSSTGSTADVVDIKSNLGPAPSLDANGELRFSFGGRLRVTGRVSGTFHGSIPITADYP
jgi:Domain of unknown function (DUF4402)